MKKDIVIVGGGPAGIITAQTARSVHPNKQVCLVKSVGEGVIPCAMPYMFRTLETPEQNRMGDQPLLDAGIEIIVDNAVALDAAAHRVELEGGGPLEYEKLVLATGLTPTRPPIPGIELEGVHTMEKSLPAMARLKKIVSDARTVVVLGGGFIGAEIADELCDAGTRVHVIEMMPNVLCAAFDSEFCAEAGALLEQAGVHLHTSCKATSIVGNGRVESVVLDNGERIPTDLLIVSIGGRPASQLAADAGLQLSANGAIWVDAYMRTTGEDIFAVGDCALKRSFFTRKEVPVWLASTATAEARIAGTNLYQLRVLRQIQGTVGAFSTRLRGVCFASAGLTTRACEEEGFRYVAAEASAPDRHPGAIPGASPLRVKLVFADRAGALLGGQVMGGSSAGELINAIAISIQMGLNVRQLDMMQIATHPLLSPAPTVHPLINAAHSALASLRGF